MFIDRNITKHHAQFGGAECFYPDTGLLEFRSSERRRWGVARAIAISPLTG